MPRIASAGRHENGQNFLHDREVIARIVSEVASTAGPIVEIGPGDGAITAPLLGLGRELIAIEIDHRWVRRLRSRLADPLLRVEHGDYLRAQPMTTPHVVVGNVPFHLTTAILRRLLADPHWTDALLLVQWEVARRRAGIGGATLLTAQWWPWYEFAVLRRVPARAFRPAPNVDGGLLRIGRRRELPERERAPYQRFVRRVFTGPGRGLPDILRRTGAFEPARLHAWLRDHRVPAHALPRDLTAQEWVSLWRATRPRPGRDRRSRPRQAAG